MASRIARSASVREHGIELRFAGTARSAAAFGSRRWVDCRARRPSVRVTRCVRRHLERVATKSLNHALKSPDCRSCRLRPHREQRCPHEYSSLARWVHAIPRRLGGDTPPHICQRHPTAAPASPTRARPCARSRGFLFGRGGRTRSSRARGSTRHSAPPRWRRAGAAGTRRA